MDRVLDARQRRTGDEHVELWEGPDELDDDWSSEERDRGTLAEYSNRERLPLDLRRAGGDRFGLIPPGATLAPFAS